MRTAGIKDLKCNLSSYLEFVKKGETIVVLDRKKPIAEIKKIEESCNLTEQYILESTKNNSLIPAKNFKKIPIGIFENDDSIEKNEISKLWKEAYAIDRQ